MQSRRNLLIALILVLLLGVGSGYYLGKRQTGKNEKAVQKLDLLKSYTDFIFLPKEKIGDPVAFADDMEKKVETIGDDVIASKYNATGESENKEQKIIDFLDFLNNSIRSDLQGKTQ